MFSATCLFVFTPACTPDGSRAEAGTAADDGIRSLAQSPEYCTTCISLELFRTLGDEEGDGYLRVAMFAAVDSLGQFWVSQPDGPKVFTAGGEFIQQVGGRGQGPGEFMDAGDLYVAPSGNVHIIDRGNLRESVYSPERAFVQSVPLPGPTMQAVTLSDGRVLANFAIPSPEKVGLPLHFVRDGVIEKSVGPTQGSHGLSMPRKLAGHPGRQSVFAVGDREYLIKEWGEDGTLIQSIRNDGAWSPPGLDATTAVSPTSPPSPFVIDLAVGGDGLLWLVYWVPRPDWADGLEEVRFPDGEIGYQPAGGETEAVMSSVIDVIDPETGELMAQFASNYLVGGLIGDSLAYGVTHDVMGAPRLSIWEVSSNVGGS
jgi:hypothetical protein